MPSRPRWKKALLLAIVSLAHAGLLYSFSAGQSNSRLPAAASNKNPRVIVQASISLLKKENGSEPQVQASEPAPTVAQSNTNSALRETPGLTDSPRWLGLENQNIFLDADAVDETARPDVNFEVALSQRLPLRVESMVLEFWIDKEGVTVQVRCLEGACSDVVDATLIRLAELRFTPAIKNRAPVASRKVMQIDPLPTFGL